MRILIVTALFPPDVAAPAPYVKELATRLASDHDVTVLTYGNIPETIAGVRIETVSKELPLWQRLLVLRKAIWDVAHEHDIVVINNAPSTELPAWAASWYVRTRWYLLMSDRKIVYTGWRKFVHQLAASRLRRLAANLPLSRPEQHPFHPPTGDDWQRYEQSWEQHLIDLEHTFSS